MLWYCLGGHFSVTLQRFPLPGSLGSAGRKEGLQVLGRKSVLEEPYGTRICDGAPGVRREMEGPRKREWSTVLSGHSLLANDQGVLKWAKKPKSG